MNRRICGLAERWNVARCTLSTPAHRPKEKIDPLKEYTPFGGLKTKTSNNPFHYTDRRSGAGYSHYSSSLYLHRPYIWPPLRKLFNFNFVLAFSLILPFLFNYDYLYDQLKSFSASFRPEAQQLKEVEDDRSKENKEAEKPKRKKKEIGFRERRVIEYEDRLRIYSSPDKIFRYFATLKIITEKEGKTSDLILMTPEDFVRSFTPGVMQPRKYGLDKFKLYDPKKDKVAFSNRKSIFFHLGQKGLITYSDYLFLMTLLSTSPKDFEVAFQIFDINGDGALDISEFHRVQELVMSQTTVGQKHRDHSMAKASFTETNNSVLERYFFGPDRKDRLTPEKFLEFQAQLHRDVLCMELERRAADEGRDDESVSCEAFALMLIQYADLSEKKRNSMLRRLKERGGGGVWEDGVKFSEVQDLFHVLFHIDSLDSALHFHRLAGKSVTAGDLKRIIRKVTGVQLPEDVLFVVVTIFDENGDGALSNDEFVRVLRRRLQRGLERPRDTGLFRLVEAFTTCTLKRLNLAS